MTMVEKAVALLLVISSVYVTEGVVHKVGDSAGWTTIGNVDYKKWASTKNFQVGDIIIFEYNSQFHSVMRVTHEMYKACNASTPLATFTTGNDSIKITNHGHHFFLCGVPGHCQAGQKVDINVLRTNKAIAPTPSSPSSEASPTVPASNVVPAPSPRNAAPLVSGKGVIGMALVMTICGIAASIIVV